MATKVECVLSWEVKQSKKGKPYKTFVLAFPSGRQVYLFNLLDQTKKSLHTEIKKVRTAQEAEKGLPS